MDFEAALQLYWAIQSGGYDAAIELTQSDESTESIVASEIFERLPKKKQAEVMQRVRELERLPNGRTSTQRGSQVARPPGVSESIWVTYLSVVAIETELRIEVMRPVPWLIAKAHLSSGLVIHPDIAERSPWSFREIGQWLLGMSARQTRRLYSAAIARADSRLFSKCPNSALSATHAASGHLQAKEDG